MIEFLRRRPKDSGQTPAGREPSSQGDGRLSFRAARRALPVPIIILTGAFAGCGGTSSSHTTGRSSEGTRVTVADIVDPKALAVAKLARDLHLQDPKRFRELPAEGPRTVLLIGSRKTKSDSTTISGFVDATMELNPQGQPDPKTVKDASLSWQVNSPASDDYTSYSFFRPGGAKYDESAAAPPGFEGAGAQLIYNQAGKVTILDTAWPAQNSVDDKGKYTGPVATAEAVVANFGTDLQGATAALGLNPTTG